jgi:putative glycosyltransferase
MALIFSTYLLALHFSGNNILPGWISILASIWILGGLIISCLGILGIYIAKIFIESKKRPISIIKKIHGK